LQLAERAERCRDLILAHLTRLSADGLDAALVHEIRMGLRRLQAYREVLGDQAAAKVLADCTSKLSRLRTLQVFSAYLEDEGAPRRDRRKVEKAVEEEYLRLQHKEAFRKIERRVRRYGLPLANALPPADADDAGEAAEAALDKALTRAEARPRRKRLHALRLRVKTVRYLVEWLTHEHARPSPRLAGLKRAQSVLGAYEERAEFRKLARKLDLDSASRIKKDWRRARRRARKTPKKLRLALLDAVDVKSDDRRVLPLHSRRN
jgi:CHAD domain-containing protein